MNHQYHWTITIALLFFLVGCQTTHQTIPQATPAIPPQALAHPLAIAHSTPSKKPDQHSLAQSKPRKSHKRRVLSAGTQTGLHSTLPHNKQPADHLNDKKGIATPIDTKTSINRTITINKEGSAPQAQPAQAETTVKPSLPLVESASLHKKSLVQYMKAIATGYEEKGFASWYGPRFNRHRTSSGERYNMYAMTAAHNSLPLHSYAKITNLRNGHSIIVRINDRGPFRQHRLIDLSYAAAKKLGILKRGTGYVDIQAINPHFSLLA